MKLMDMDEIYRTIPQEDIPWNMEEPPEALVELIENGKVLPCKAAPHLAIRAFMMKK